MHPSRARVSSIVLAIVLSFGGCATMQVGSYAARGADFGEYFTFNWGPPDFVPTGDPRLDSNPFFQERVYADVERELRSRRFDRSVADTPDLLVHFHASLVQRIDPTGLDRERGYCSAENCRPFVYEAGTLLLDFVDTRDNRLVWRGWAVTSMDRVIDNQDLMEKRIDEAVANILRKMPPRGRNLGTVWNSPRPLLSTIDGRARK